MKQIKAENEVNIRFSDTDSMGVFWHGNYLKFFEDVREVFAQKYKIDYLEVYKKGFFMPIVKSGIDHKAPIFYGQKAKVFASLIPTPSAKVIFEYKVINLATDKIAATGKTIQVFLTAEARELSLYKPDFYIEWEKSVGLNY
jgi:acyl-CoA thioester hydrolase